MPAMQTRRRFLTTLSVAGAAGLVRAPRALAAEGALETTTVRIAKLESICVAPQDVAEELLRAEGFGDIRYVPLPTGLADPLNEHLIKLVGFEFSPELRQHFRQELDTWLDKIQRLRIKPNNRTGTPKFYYDLLFDYPNSK